MPRLNLETGNRIQKDGDIQNAVFDAANRLLEDSLFTYIYDNNGNLTQKTEKGTSQTTAYTYDAENQLIRIDFPNGDTAEYRYDGLGRRIEKSLVSGLQSEVIRYLYDGEDILLELDGANTLKARYTHGSGIDEPLIMERLKEGTGSDVLPVPSFESFFYLSDGLGSITELTDSAGAVVESYLYDSFGNLTLFDAQGSLLSIHDSRSTIHYSYTGREFGPESGLYYYRARYYDSQVGRFMSEDPISGFRDVPQTLNKYAYTENNPINFVDPLGLRSVSDTVKVGLSGLEAVFSVFGVLKVLPGGPFVAIANLYNFASSVSGGGFDSSLVTVNATVGLINYLTKRPLLGPLGAFALGFSIGDFISKLRIPGTLNSTFGDIYADFFTNPGAIQLTDNDNAFCFLF